VFFEGVGEMTIEQQEVAKTKGGLLDVRLNVLQWLILVSEMV